MRVAFDISRLYLNQTGIGSYIQSLQTALDSVKPADLEIIYLKPNFLNKQQKPTNQKSFATAKLLGKINRIGAKAWEHFRLNYWYQVQLPLQLWKLKCDLLFSPDPASPIFAPCPSVIMLYDLLVDMYPQFYGKAWRWLYHLFDQNALLRTDKVICASEATRADFLRLHRFPVKRTAVIYGSYDPAFRQLPDAQVATTLAKFDLQEKPYLLFVGGTNPRKNLRGVLAAFEILSANWPDLQLVVVGINAGNKSSSRTATAPQSFDWTSYGISPELSRRVLMPGYLPRPDLIALYNGAVALVFPSLYEGFGIPPLEAMACGCPVVAANTGSLPEICGEAALYCDPLQPSAIANQLTKLLENPQLRQDLRQAGFDRIKKFDWQSTAQRIIEIFLDTATQP